LLNPDNLILITPLFHSPTALVPELFLKLGSDQAVSLVNNSNMAKYSKGVQGPFSGTLGTVVGTTWMGMPVMRSRPTRRKSGFSPLELQQQSKFKQMSLFLSPLSTLMNTTFKPVAVRMTGFNKGYSYNFKNAFTGEYPDLKIDYSMVALGKGDLPNAGSPLVAVAPEGKLDFRWTDNSGKGKALATDKVFAAVYCEEKKDWKWWLNKAARSEAVFTVNLIPFIGMKVQTYIGFVSADGKEVSDTIYTGEISL
jgi:hypothetical protein